jgi:acyl carrier protein
MATEGEIYSALTAIFRDVFMRDDLELQPGMTAKDISGWDSYKQIEIIMATEERFRIRMTTREVDSLQSVGDLVRMVTGKATL